MVLNKQQDSRKTDSFAFGMNLVIELVLLFVERRSRNDIAQKIKLVLEELSVTPSFSIGLLTPFTPISEGQRRCELCKSEII